MMFQRQHLQPLKQSVVDSSPATPEQPLPTHVIAPREQLEQPENGLLNERPAKRTRFSPTSTLIIVKPRSDRDIKLTWYNRGDMSQFRRDTRRVTQVLRNSRTAAKVMEALADPSIVIGSNSTGDSSCSDDGSCFHINGVEHIRGIEHLLSQDVLQVLVSQRRSNVAKILEEQEFHRRMQESDCSSVLKSVSESYSLFAKEWCQKLAKLH
mmetsp:Transcript_24368/g.51410  ORF Transcript_24368/g.51410 Transcript_24368/m.51410 type:complete len:210 (+) Transcript_24368:155-784(+)